MSKEAHDILTKHIDSTVCEMMNSAVGTKGKAGTIERNRKMTKTIDKPFANPMEVNINEGENLPLNFCVYQEEVKSYVLIPPGYGQKYYSKHKHSNPPFCERCHLKPCMNAEYAKEIYGDGHKLASYIDINYKEASTEEGQALWNDKIAKHLRDKVRNIMDELYGKEYARKKPIPKCVWDKIHFTFPGREYFSDWDEDGYSTSDDEENIDPDKILNPKYF